MLIAEFPDHPQRMLGSEVSDCGTYLVLTVVEERNENLIFFAKLDSESMVKGFPTRPKLIPLIEDYIAEFTYITNDGPLIYLLTNYEATNVQLIAVDLHSPKDPSKWRTIIPEHERNVMHWVAPINQNLVFVCYIKDVRSNLQLHRLSDGVLLQRFKLDLGTIVGFSGDRNSTEFFFQFQSFFTPGETYHVDFKAQDAKGSPKSGCCCCSKTRYKAKLLDQLTIKNSELELSSKTYKSYQVFYDSKDGTKVPMFILRKKEFKKKRGAPCFLYAHGGFGSNLECHFHLFNLVLMHNLDGVIAIANIRGGGEYGQKWHEEGRLLKKQNSFDDFIAAAEYMIKEKYTCARKIIINGGPHGGLLVGNFKKYKPPWSVLMIMIIIQFDL